MKFNLKNMAYPHAVVFSLALVVALIARLGLSIMDQTGTLSYNYISKGGVSVLDTLGSIITGPALIAFMFAAALALIVSTAGVVLQGLLYVRGVKGAGSPGRVFIWGWATALVSIACLFIVATVILSPLQISSMSSKLPHTLILVGAAVVFAAFLGTLLAAASMVVCACLAKARDEKRAGINLIIATIFCGLVVMLLTINTFAAINVVSIDTGKIGMWFAIDLVVNLVILFSSYLLMPKPKA